MMTSGAGKEEEEDGVLTADEDAGAEEDACERSEE